MQSQLPRKAIIAITGHSASFYPDGRKNGAFYTEVAHPYQALTKAGFEVDLASETGTFAIDAYSLEKQFLSEDDVVALNAPDHPLNILLKSGLRKASALKADEYGLFFASVGLIERLQPTLETPLNNRRKQRQPRVLEHRNSSVPGLGRTEPP